MRLFASLADCDIDVELCDDDDDATWIEEE
jgi:hypothetical protein